MAPKEGKGIKRKLPSHTKDSTTNKKKPKFEKRPPPPPANEEDGISDGDEFGDLSENDGEGGAPLNETKAQRNGDQQIRSKEANGQAGQGVFIRAYDIQSTSTNSAQAKPLENLTRNRNSLLKIEKRTNLWPMN